MTPLNPDDEVHLGIPDMDGPLPVVKAACGVKGVVVFTAEDFYKVARQGGRLCDPCVAYAMWQGKGEECGKA